MVGPQWLETISEVTGLDPLGIQAISIRVYGFLLPGLSNVTNRLRYYSFLCWVLYNYLNTGGTDSLDDWRKYLRKSEFLFSLISDVHHIDDPGHNSSLVGSDKSTPLIRRDDLKVINLEKYTQFEDSPYRYFKNKGGGFAQAYKGPMDDMKLIVKGGPLRIQLADDVKKTSEKRFGMRTAEAFSKNRHLDLFHKCIVKGRVARAELKLMGDSLCACKIIGNKEECDLLVSLLFDLNNQFGRSGIRRRQTLYLILKFLKDNEKKGISVEEFRNICMYRHYPNGKEIGIHRVYDDILLKWGIYQTHEYFCYALESIFCVFERLIDEHSGNYEDIFEFVRNEVQAKYNISVENGSNAFGDVKFSGGTKLDQFIKSIEFSNHDDPHWAISNTSEFYLKNKIDELVRSRDFVASLSAAYILLIKIYIKTQKLKDFYDYGDKLNFRIYSVNINALKNIINENIKSENDLWVFIKRVLKEFIVDRHTIVALRKFRYEKKSTLRYTTENNVYVRSKKLKYDLPVFTNPRLQQAFRFLEDLGMSKKLDNKKYIITESGKQFMAGINEL